MLEILALIGMGKRIGAILREKGRNATGYQVLLVVLWFGGEIVGAIVGALLTDGQGGLATYLFALIGAAIGAGLAFVLANSVSSTMSTVYQQQGSMPILQPAGMSVIQSSSSSGVLLSSAEERLGRLNELRSKILITEQEFQERRRQILNEL